MFRFAIERGMAVSVAFIILCLLGVVAVRSVPVQMTPNLDKPVITVLTLWPGATPLDIEKEIIVEQEQYLRKVRDLNKLVSQASMGRAQIELEFNLGTDMGEALVLVNNALSQVAGYPENVDQPRLVSSSSSDDPFIFYTISRRADSPANAPVYDYLDFFEDNVATELERVPGVAQVTFGGGSSREVKVYVDPARLAARQLTMADVRRAIRDRNRDSSGGDIDAGKRRFVVRTIGRFESVEAISDTILGERDGHSVRLRDVGHVELGVAELRGKSYSGTEQSLIFMVRREPGANVIEVKRGVTAAVAMLNEHQLQAQGLVAELYADDVGYVVEAVEVVKKNLLLGGVLACAVLFVFLRAIYPTLLGTLGVPICTIGAFIGLLLTGRTINVISLAGVAFAIGMTLDNSIVVLENIYRQRMEGKAPFDASLDGVREVWRAVLASTLTTVLVFVPVALMQNEAGQLYSDIAIAISAAVLMSMLVAVTLLPSAAARLPFHGRQGSDRLSRCGTALAERLLDAVRWLLAAAWRQIGLVLATLLLALAIVVFLTPQAEYLPEGEEPKLFGLMLPPPGYNLAEMDRVGQDIARDLIANATPGGTVPELRYLLWFVTPDRLFSVSESVDKSPEALEALRSALRERFTEIPGMLAFVNRGSIFSGNFGGTRAIELDISGADLSAIFAVARQAFGLATAAFDGAQIRPDPSLSQSQPTVEIHPDWERVRELGIPTADLGYMIWTLSDGAYVDEFFLRDDKIDMFLYSTQGAVERPEDLVDLPIYAPSGVVLPLAAIAEVRETVTANQVRRVDARRTVTLTIIPPHGVALERAVEVVQTEVIQKLQRDAMAAEDVRIAIGGASDKLRATREALQGNFVIAIALSYLVMAAILSHWGYPLLILLTLPLGISGGIAGLWIMNHVVGVEMSLDMLTMLGMIVLIGTVVNNPILLVEQARGNLARGLDASTAIVEAVRARLRPIMMSMLTTIFGLGPVVFLPGAGTELYRGLGTIVLFGLFFSTLLTLTFVPALLALLFSAGARWRVARAGADGV